jgi:hypothetical protein
MTMNFEWHLINRDVCEQFFQVYGEYSDEYQDSDEFIQKEMNGRVALGEKTHERSAGL